MITNFFKLVSRFFKSKCMVTSVVTPLNSKIGKPGCKTEPFKKSLILFKCKHIFS